MALFLMLPERRCRRRKGLTLSSPCIENRSDTRYAHNVIRSFRHAGLEKFYATGSKAGIQPAHAKRLQLQLFALNNATSPADMAVYLNWGLHPLRGEMAGRFAVWVNGNWRVTFAFEGVDAIIVDYQDYH